MTWRSVRWALALLLWLAGPGAAGSGLTSGPSCAAVWHDLEVVLDPATGTLRARDRITITPPRPASQVELTLSRALAVDSADGSVTADEGGRADGDLRSAPPSAIDSALRRYRARAPAGTLTLSYAGRIRGPAKALAAGHIGPRGAFLDGGSAWVPRVEIADECGPRPFGFRLTVHHPAGWQAVSQGRRGVADDPTRVTWTTETPQWEAYLVAGPLRRFEAPAAPAIGVYLRADDDALAAVYQRHGREYLRLYERLLGPYPYPKLAVVEHFRETGFAMPSFTVLGPRVMRLPFMLQTSYPHEILHNWLGNGVHADPSGGNWAEGLTAYLADHLMQERRGLGAVHRRRTLQRYRSYVARSDDFSLASFRGGHDRRRQAVGYGKALMFFHGLRRKLGDRAFVAGLRSFYRDHRFRRVGYAALKASFEAAGGAPLSDEFAQWIERVGAPELRLGGLDVQAGGGEFRLRGTIEQVQPGPPYRLEVNVGVQLHGEPRLVERVVRGGARSTRFTLVLPARPLRVILDPGFDLFRRLHRSEVPPSIGELLGDRRLRLILPRLEPETLRAAYARMAARWRSRFGFSVAWDDPPAPDPGRSGPVLLLGARNRWVPALVSRVEGLPLALHPTPDGQARGLGVDGQPPAAADSSFAVAARAGGTGFGWLTAPTPGAVAAFARRLPHYGRYGLIVAEGPGATVTQRREWPAERSVLERWLAAPGKPGPTPRAQLAPRTRLTDRLR